METKMSLWHWFKDINRVEPIPMSLCLSQILHGLTWNGTWTSTKTRRLSSETRHCLLVTKIEIMNFLKRTGYVQQEV
jgi:hypothetical protein